jgi:hypothetical protein
VAKSTIALVAALVAALVEALVEALVAATVCRLDSVIVNIMGFIAVISI